MQRQVQVLVETLVLEQKVGEGITAARVARRYQITQGMILDVRAWQQHVGLPERAGSSLHKAHRQRGRQLLKSDG
ncbi:hypothetical protein D3C78_1794130 [compost metagenome]